MDKLFSKLEIKSTEESGGKRTFKGIASTPTPDRVEDVVEPKGAVFELPIPLLWQHSAKDPIGWVTKAKVTNAGIEVEGEVAVIEEEGDLKKAIDKAWHSLKYKLVRGLSIGFKALESARIAGTDWGEHILKWAWYELSAVTIPCNQECNITAIKSAYNQQFKAASGHKSFPGASGQNERVSVMKTLQEQLADLREAKATKTGRLKELTDLIQAKSATDADTLEFDNLVDEIKELDNGIRVKQAECISAGSATSITSTVKTAPTVITKSKDQEEKFKGQNYTRMVIAKAVAKLDDISPVAVAQKRWGKSNPTVVNIIKAAVEGGGSGSGEWAAELVSADNRYTGDFIEYLHEKTVFDQLPLREVPANVAIKGQDGAATGYWVGESAAIPASAQDFSTVNLTPLKVAALAVVSNELLRDSSPSAEMLVRDALVMASAQRVDSTFFSNVAISAGVSPAGILNGITGKNASGTDADSLRADIKTVITDFITAKNAGGLEVCMNPALALSIQMLYNALGNPEFPDINQEGGRLLGMPVHTGDNIDSSDLIILKPSDIYKIGDGGVQISISREAMIEMDDAPAMESQGPTGPTGATVGMFQTESTAIKVVRPINFQRRRTGSSCVGFIDDAAYDNSSS